MASQDSCASRRVGGARSEIKAKQWHAGPKALSETTLRPRPGFFSSQHDIGVHCKTWLGWTKHDMSEAELQEAGSGLSDGEDLPETCNMCAPQIGVSECLRRSDGQIM